MIIFVLALVVLIAALIVNFLPSLKNNRVLIMSVLAILMIMVNFINEIDIIVSPPQLFVKVDSRNVGPGKQPFIKLDFNQRFQTQQMKYLTKTLTNIRQSVQTSLKQSISFTEEQKKFILQRLQTLPLKEYTKTLIKPENYLFEQFKQRLVQGQDSIIHVQGIEKARFQLLIQYYIEDVNDKADKYGLKFEKVMILPIYAREINESNSKGYKFSEKLSESYYHYIVVFDFPTQKLLKFLYEQYTSSSSHLSIIFLELNQKVNIFPISPFIQHIYLPQITYIDPINQFVRSNTRTTDGKESIQSLNKIQSQLETCEQYIEMDFDFLLRLIAFGNNKILSKTCYETLLEPISQEIKCFRSMINEEYQQISLHQAKKCWPGKTEPNGLIWTQNNKLRLKKQHYWADKVTPKNFGLEIVTKKCSNQL